MISAKRKQRFQLHQSQLVFTKLFFRINRIFRISLCFCDIFGFNLNVCLESSKRDEIRTFL